MTTGSSDTSDGRLGPSETLDPTSVVPVPDVVASHTHELEGLGPVLPRTNLSYLDLRRKVTSNLITMSFEHTDTSIIPLPLLVFHFLPCNGGQ